MSDEIVDVEVQHSEKIIGETINKDGLINPDPSMVTETSEEEMQEIIERREELSSLPDYPKEWQEGYEDEGEDILSKTNLPITATLKQDEINKLIKKYKRYMKSNLREIRRVEDKTENYDS
jgi:hypothetical protein